MAKLFIEIDAELESRLASRAARHGRRSEEEAACIVRQAVEAEAVQEEKEYPMGLGSEIAALFRGIGLTEEIQELRCAID